MALEGHWKDTTRVLQGYHKGYCTGAIGTCNPFILERHGGTADDRNPALPIIRNIP